ncbi:MAG TPA: hypothetical protein PKW73_05120, partial [Candidatus Obscuribacter sp.]|nr:hypothetical protein [Candidatus Obscuribacter sp.]
MGEGNEDFSEGMSRRRFVKMAGGLFLALSAGGGALEAKQQDKSLKQGSQASRGGGAAATGRRKSGFELGDWRG